MNETYYTVEQISEILNIHPKTIQRYIREGKLRATKIGKSWRVTGHDLSLFTERDETTTNKNTPHEIKAIVSSVCDIDVDGRDEAIRIMNSLTAVLNVKPPEYGRSTLHTQFIESENKVRVTLWGGVHFMAVMMDAIDMLTSNNNEE
jgi:excisionase family DNA binding protein